MGESQDGMMTINVSSTILSSRQGEGGRGQDSIWQGTWEVDDNNNNNKERKRKEKEESGKKRTELKALLGHTAARIAPGKVAVWTV